jgi:cephalosporin hydroxylase
MSELRKFFDDVTKSSDKWEPYFEIYERHLKDTLQNKRNISLVEVGVQKGGSLEMWAEWLKDHWTSYIEKFDIEGIDIDPECAKMVYADPRIKVTIGDQSSRGFWDEYLASKEKIDIFIDDGGHYMDQQILTFEKVFPKLSIGGVYVCEDTHTSYMSGNGGGLQRKGTFIEYAKGFVDVLHYNWKEEMTSDLEHKKHIAQGLSSVHFYDSVVVFEKFGKKEMKRVFPKQFPAY